MQYSVFQCNVFNFVFLKILGEQQDECVRCGKVYLAAVNAKQKGICLRCFESNKLIDVTKTGFQYDVELATEDDSSNDSNELSDK